MRIRRSRESDEPSILAIINDAAQAYRGVIPADRWHEPYMPTEELAREIAVGVEFWVAEEDGRVLGVMGIQDKGDVALVRHAYTATTLQRSGLGTKLLRHVQGLADKPILIGTWASAVWAIGFYQRNGFTVVSDAEKDRLLRKYWSIERALAPRRSLERVTIPLVTQEIKLLTKLERALDLEKLIGPRGSSMLRAGRKIELEGATNTHLYGPSHGRWIFEHLRSRPSGHSARY